MEWFLFPAGAKYGNILQNPDYGSVKLSNFLKNHYHLLRIGHQCHTEGMTVWMRADRLLLRAPALSWPDAK